MAARPLANDPGRIGWVNPAGEMIRPSGLTADEVKLNQGQKVKSSEVLYVPPRRPTEFIQGAVTSDEERVGKPPLAEPFPTPTGPLHNHMHVRKRLQLSHHPTMKALNDAVDNPRGISAEAQSKMKASIDKEYRMLARLHVLQKDVETIYARLAGDGVR